MSQMSQVTKILLFKIVLKWYDSTSLVPPQKDRSFRYALQHNEAPETPYDIPEYTPGNPRCHIYIPKGASETNGHLQTTTDIFRHAQTLTDTPQTHFDPPLHTLTPIDTQEPPLRHPATP